MIGEGAFLGRPLFLVAQALLPNRTLENNGPCIRRIQNLPTGTDPKLEIVFAGAIILQEDSAGQHVIPVALALTQGYLFRLFVLVIAWPTHKVSKGKFGRVIR